MANAPDIDALVRSGPARGQQGPHWPEGTVRALLATDLVTAPTRQALQSRLDTPVVTTPCWLSPDEFATLAAVCTRLIPQTGRAALVDLPGPIDLRLTQDRGDGWRYAEMPSDRDAYREGLRGLDETSRLLFGTGFRRLEGSCQDAVLAMVQHGDPPGKAWRELPPSRFFEELLADVVDVFYAHPLAQEEIGYVGMADAHGWHSLGLNERAAHEPLAIANDESGARHE